MDVLDYSSGKDHHRPRPSKRFVVICLLAPYAGVVMARIWESAAIAHFIAVVGGTRPLYTAVKYPHYENWCLTYPVWTGLVWILWSLVFSTVALTRRGASAWVILLSVLATLAAIPILAVMFVGTAKAKGMLP